MDQNKRIVLVGSPNTGKTTLFNALTGLRAQTANFPGTTVEQKSGTMTLPGKQYEIIDLPGMYSLNAPTPEESIARDVVLGRVKNQQQPDAAIVIADAGNLERSLFIVSQLMECCIPVVIALNLVDVAESHGIHVDTDILAQEIGCPVVPMVARTGKGLDILKRELEKIFENKSKEKKIPSAPMEACEHCESCPFQTRYSWSDSIAKKCVNAPLVAKEQKTEKIDKFLTHPLIGLGVFLSVMLGIFYLIFNLANIPMDMIDGLFGALGAWVKKIIPEGDLQSLIADGIIGGVGGILVFLPQICILFFFLAFLEDSGYLARAAFVMDRLMRRIGLPGTAFVPLLSAHACTIPAIMSTRVIRDHRDRLVTILVAPLMTCSARIPVYALVTALLFPQQPGRASLVFMAAYSLGIIMALFMAFVFKKTILPGESKPLVLELPGYRIPGLRTVLLYTLDRALVFVKQAGTIILLISISLWFLATYPKSEMLPSVKNLIRQSEILQANGNLAKAKTLRFQYERLASRHALSQSFAGRLGRFIEPVVRPLGFDWQIGIGIISSFAAREVIVSTLSIVYGLGDSAEENPEGLYETLQRALHDDGTPVFTTATSISLLIFYILAMQCLPTQAATKRETNSWKWPLFQLLYMTILAYGCSFIAYQSLRFFGS